MLKQFFITFMCFNCYLITAQETKKPEYVIIANNEIITQIELQDYAKNELIKGMHKGVTQEERNKLAEQFGDKIGDREFIIKIDLFTESEKEEQKKKQKNTPKPKKDRTTELFLNVNDVAKNFTVEMINGEKITLSNLKGKVVLINFWATWCAPCLMEFAEFPEKILKPFENKDFILIPIAIGDSKQKATNKMLTMEKYGVHFNVGVDPDKQIWNNYATGAIPKNFIIDKTGKIKYISIGNSKNNVDELAKQIKTLLN